MRLQEAGAVRDNASNLADISFFEFHQAFVKPVGGRREHRNFGFSRQFEDLDCVPQRAGDRLVDEQRLAGFDDKARLLQVRTAIHAFQEHGIHLLAEFLDRSDHLQVEFFLQLLGIALHPAGAGFDVLASALVSRDDFGAGNVFLLVGVIQQSGESGHVRGVQADDPNPDLGGGGVQGHGEAGG